MAKRLVIVIIGMALLLGACLGAASQEALEQGDGVSVLVYKEPT